MLVLACAHTLMKRILYCICIHIYYTTHIIPAALIPTPKANSWNSSRSKLNRNQGYYTNANLRWFWLNACMLAVSVTNACVQSTESGRSLGRQNGFHFRRDGQNFCQMRVQIGVPHWIMPVCISLFFGGVCVIWGFLFCSNDRILWTRVGFITNLHPKKIRSWLKLCP